MQCPRPLLPPGWCQESILQAQETAPTRGYSLAPSDLTVLPALMCLIAAALSGSPHAAAASWRETHILACHGFSVRLRGAGILSD